MTNNHPSLVLKQLHLLTFANGDKFRCYLLQLFQAQHYFQISRVPYRHVKGDEPLTMLNQKAALLTTKIIANQIGSNIINLEEFEPECPDCRSQDISEDIPGDLCCHNCGLEGPKSEFFTGGI